MTFTLEAAITAARDRHAAFHRTRIPNGVLARFASDYQNALIARAVARDAQFLRQTTSILVALNQAVSGANTGPGLPGTVTEDGGFSTSDQTTGSLIDAIVDPDRGATLLVAEQVVTSATANTLSASAAWTVNAYADAVVVITQGAGIGQRRRIISNSSGQLVISTGSDGYQWETIPNTSSLFEIVTPELTSLDDVALVTAVPSTTTKTGYLVKLDASGLPHIDYSTPLVATESLGVTLPSMLALLGGTVWSTDDSSCPLVLAKVRQRFAPPGCYSAYQIGQTLHLCGDEVDWQDVASIEVHYVPIAPDFSALDDVFLLPDSARPAVVAQMATFMADRVAGMPDIAIDPVVFDGRSTKAENDFLSSLRLNKRGRSSFFREATDL
jgi:hypothetical protein